MLERYPELQKLSRGVRGYPQFMVAFILVLGGSTALIYDVPSMAGALYGAGAAMLGSGLTEWNSSLKKKSATQSRHADAIKIFAPELYRSIRHVIHNLQRESINFLKHALNQDAEPGDQREDFLPPRPVIFPHSLYFRDLDAETASVLISYYDAVEHSISFTNDWWKRDGLLPRNVFLVMMHNSMASLQIAKICIERFHLTEHASVVDPSLPPLLESIDLGFKKFHDSLKLAIDNDQKSHVISP